MMGKNWASLREVAKPAGRFIFGGLGTQGREGGCVW